MADPGDGEVVCLSCRADLNRDDVKCWRCGSDRLESARRGTVVPITEHSFSGDIPIVRDTPWRQLDEDLLPGGEVKAGPFSFLTGSCLCTPYYSCDRHPVPTMSEPCACGKPASYGEKSESTGNVWRYSCEGCAPKA